MRESPREIGGFCVEIDHNPRSSDCVAGDAVLSAPVSGRIPCKQGILQGNLRFGGPGDDFGAGSRCAAGTFRAFPYSDEQGKQFEEQGIFQTQQGIKAEQLAHKA
jgi:hypothetical protein